MKIGIVVDNELNNDKRVLREIGILKEHGFEIFVLCFGFSGTYNNPYPGINIGRIYIPRKLKDILFFMMNTVPIYEWMWSGIIRKFIKANPVDFLHVHDLYMSGAAHRGIKKSKTKIPLVLDLHENYPYSVTTYNWTKGFFRHLISQPEKWQRREEEYLNYADKIVILSNDFSSLLQGKYPHFSGNKFVVFPNVPNLMQVNMSCKFPVKNPFDNNYPTILYYGVIAERRGIFDALNVFTLLVKEGHNLNFLLIGPIDKKDRNRFSELTGSDIKTGRLHYIPWINSMDFPCYLDICEICIAPFHKNPQHESGVANKIYEYMLGAKPVIASDCKPQQEIIEKHDCGIVFKNMNELREGIIRLISDENLRKKMGMNGKEAVLNEYNTDISKDNLISIYQAPVKKAE